MIESSGDKEKEYEYLGENLESIQKEDKAIDNYLDSIRMQTQYKNDVNQCFSAGLNKLKQKYEEMKDFDRLFDLCNYEYMALLYSQLKEKERYLIMKYWQLSEKIVQQNNPLLINKAIKSLEKCFSLIDPYYRTEYEVKIQDYYTKIGKFFLENNQMEDALSCINNALKALLKETKQDYDLLSETYLMFSHYYIKLKNLDEAFSFFDKAVDAKEKKSGANSYSVRCTFGEMHKICDKYGFFEEMVDYCLNQKRTSTVNSQFYLDFSSKCRDKGKKFLETGDKVNAEKMFYKGFKVRRAAVDDDDQERAYNYLGDDLESLGEEDKALEIYFEWIKLQILKQKGSSGSSNLSRREMEYYNSRQYDKLYDLYMKKIKYLESNLGKDRLDLCETYLKIGENLLKFEKYLDAGIEIIIKVIDIATVNLGENHKELLNLYNKVWMNYIKSKKIDKAFLFFEKAMDNQIHNSGPQNMYLMRMYFDLFYECESNGFVDEMVNRYLNQERTYTLVHEHYYKDITDNLKNKANILKEEGNLEKSENYMKLESNVRNWLINFQGKNEEVKNNSSSKKNMEETMITGPSEVGPCVSNSEN